MVDTTFIGYIHKKDDEAVTQANVEYLPSQDFFEAGRFKNKQLPNYEAHEELYKVR